MTGDFIEGPCNCVNKILKETTSSEKDGIKDLVAMDSFNLDAFDTESNFHLITSNVILPEKKILKSPRVGLSLKRLDDNKPAYWLADYRMLTYPELHHKMKDT